MSLNAKECFQLTNNRRNAKQRCLFWLLGNYCLVNIFRPNDGNGLELNNICLFAMKGEILSYNIKEFLAHKNVNFICVNVNFF